METNLMRNAERGRLNENLQLENEELKISADIQPSAFRIPHSQSGMSLIAVMAAMTLFAIGLLAIAPSIQQGVQREKELEAIRRGEDVAQAIRLYVIFYQGRLPDSIDDLLEGLPYGTKKVQILRESSAVDPLSADGKWRLIEPTSQAFVSFGRRVQSYNNGSLPTTPPPSQFLDRYAFGLVNVVNTESDEDLKKESEEEIEIKTDNAPFIGVASQSRSSSMIAYYGIENHSKWVFTPLFRGAGSTPGMNRSNSSTNSNSR